jgi:hypothetical protein
MSSLRVRTNNRIKKLKELKPGYKIEIIWEHEWVKLKKTNDTIKEFVKQNRFHKPLFARDALYGGNTNTFILHKKCEPGEFMRYVDFTR